MGKIEEQLKKITKKCKILYRNQCVSDTPLLQVYIRYLSLSFRRREHNVGLIIHPHSICFDILSITFSAIINLLSNESSSEDFLESLTEGSMILYKGDKKIERYRYEGKVIKNGQEYIQLSQKKNGNRFIPASEWRRISPYNGSSTREDGRGIRSNDNKSIVSFYPDIYTDFLQIEVLNFFMFQKESVGYSPLRRTIV